MKTDFVIITSLYNLNDLKRDDKRNWNNYLEWFYETLKIKSPFIIFTEDSLVEIIKEKRKDLPTKIITEPLEKIPYYYLKDKIQDILNSEYYQKNMLDTNRIECKEAIYSVIQYSKFKWLEQAININPFSSKFFFWLDAGASRFIDDYDNVNDYPSQEALEKLKEIDDTFLLQYNVEYYRDLINSKNLTDNYFWDNRSFVCGTMFGGNKIAIENISKEIDILLDYMIENKNINNEQIALGYLLKNKDNLFSVFSRTNGKHLQLFQELA